jgi:gas vesicle protein
MSDGNRGNGETGGTGFILGLLTGSVLGVALGMLLAPKAGEELRGELEEQAKYFGEQARHFGSKASERYQSASEVATGLADRGRNVVSHAREAVKDGAEDVRGFASRRASGTDVGNSSADEAATDDGDVFRS